MIVDGKKMTREEFRQYAHEQDQKKRREFKELYVETMSEKFILDDDGYPTADALKLVEMWHWSDVEGWFKFIESIWYLKSWGWNEEDGGKDEFLDRELEPHIRRYHISTAGWSGNESVIRAMEKNDMLWFFTWVQSRRGGHYIFEWDRKKDE